jgi:hypothetical protein
MKVETWKFSCIIISLRQFNSFLIRFSALPILLVFWHMSLRVMLVLVTSSITLHSARVLAYVAKSNACLSDL